MPESPRFQAQVRGERVQAIHDLARFAGDLRVGAPKRRAANLGAAGASRQAAAAVCWGFLRAPPRGPRGLVHLGASRREPGAVSADCSAIAAPWRWWSARPSWFSSDYAYYGNALSLPAILAAVDPSATMIGKLALTPLMFAVFALPGYFLAIWRMDRFGHRRLHSLGFGVMALSFLALGAVGPSLAW